MTATTKHAVKTTQSPASDSAVKESAPAMLSPEQELTLLREQLTLANSTVCRWDLASGALHFANNAEALLGLPSGLPKTIEEWTAIASKDDKPRFKALQKSLSRQAREVDMEYTLEPKDTDYQLRIRQMGRVARGEDGNPEALVSTLMASRVIVAETQANPLENLSQDFPDRRSSDRRGYHYPPGFMKHLRLSIEHSAESGVDGVFMLLAINNLAMIINGYGFEASEKVLFDIKNALSGMVGEHDYVERIHRDQFGIILAECDRAGAESHALEMKNAIQKLTLQHEVGPLHITASIGSVCFPSPAGSVADALDKAYIALNNNNNLVFSAFEETDYDSEKSRQQMALANYLHDAISENRLRLAFQPIIRAKTGEVGHYESLLRIVDKEGKISSAGPLIPVAERMGLIEIIDRLVVEKVVEELRRHPTVELAFNISSVTTGNPEWVRYLASLLNDDLDIASRMIVEITETAAQRDLRETAYFVASVQALGCQVSLDDFGSGYTSFRQLKALSVDMLKIDGAFIRDLVDNADNRFFVKTLLDFTAGYGLHTVAEFVESGEIAKMLMELGVEYMQGYYFSQPLNYRPWLNEGEYEPE